MLGKGMGYEISTCQCNIGADNTDTDQKDPRFIYSGGNGPRKRRKYQVSWGHYHTWFAMIALRLTGPLASRDEIFTLVHKQWKRQHIKDWCAQYSSSVWDPSGVCFQDELEKVQNRAAMFVTGNYNYDFGSMTGILEHLKW